MTCVEAMDSGRVDAVLPIVRVFWREYFWRLFLRKTRVAKHCYDSARGNHQAAGAVIAG
jgi:hypothetical protein